MNAPKPHAPIKKTPAKTKHVEKAPEPKKPFKLDDRLYGKPLAENKDLKRLLASMDNLDSPPDSSAFSDVSLFKKLKEQASNGENK